MKTSIILISTLSLSLLAGVSHASAAKCENLYQLSDFDYAIEPGSIVPAEGDIPAHCQVNGVIDGTIRFQVSMPLEGWKGRMIFLAHGGNSGTIGNTTSLMKDGFAGATTNSGHNYGPQASDFVTDREALVNFGFRAVHLSTVAAKRVIAEFYGDGAKYSYIQGCSGGGRSALVEALRYPEDYDGVIAGAPATGWVDSIVPWGIAVSRQQEQHPLTAESLALLAQNSGAKCDSIDGLEDGIISTPQSCTVDVLALGDLQCGESQAQGCLTEGQIETATFIYSGLRNDAGEIVFNGIFPGDEDQGDWMMWVTGIPGQEAVLEGLPPTAYGSLGVMAERLSYEDPSFKLEEFDPIKDQAKLARRAAPVEIPPPDFTRFHANGSKLLIYQGWQDVPLRPQDTIDLLAEAAELSGGQAVVDEFSRTYLVPNMLHCAAGTGGWLADYITPMVEWVENGNAPGALIGENPGISNWFDVFGMLQSESVDWYNFVKEATKDIDPSAKSTRLLCPYPRVAKYLGTGEIKDAKNYRCD